MSLRTRLLLAVLAASVTGLAIAGVLTFTLVTRAQLEQVDQELERAHPPIERAAASPFDRERAIREAAPGFFVELRDPEGESSTVIALQRPGEDAVSIAVADLPEPESGSASASDSASDSLVRIRLRSPHPTP